MARLRESGRRQDGAKERLAQAFTAAHGAGRETSAGSIDVFPGVEAAGVAGRKVGDGGPRTASAAGDRPARHGGRRLCAPAGGLCGDQAQCRRIIPAIAPAVKGRQFNLAASEQYSRYMKEHPDAIKQLGVSSRQQTAILNYVNGKRSIARIAVCVAGELDEDVPIQGVLGYVELLEAAGWLVSSKL